MSTAATSPAASSSKRPAAAASPSTPAAKRSRPSTDSKAAEQPKDQNEEDKKPEGDEDEEEMDEEAKAKAARREARTIRNRESAQRSRNQRKAHLAWLEQRVIELEAENRALRAGTAPSSPSKTRESSPAHSIVSLASDLGIPPEVVSAGSGVNLATVAPPPSDMLEDIKPVIPPSPTPVMVEPRAIGLPPQQPSELHEENMQLRYRVSLLEGIVKQTAAYFSNNTPIDMHMVTPPPTHVMNRTHRSPHPGMDATLSPPMFPTHHREPVHSPLRLQTQLDNSVPTQPTNAPVDVSSFVDLSTPVARHPAAVATSVAVSSPERRRAQALQRARGSLTEFNLDVPANRQRLATGLDLNIGNSVVASSSSVQVGEQAQDGWFPEGPQAVQWDEEMNDLLETLEGQTNSVSPVVPGGNNAASAVMGEQWAWEAAMVEF